MIINIGSGKDYREECLNIDIQAFTKPDIVADISKDLPTEIFYTRLGPIALTAGIADEILVFDVLEHVADLVTTMSNLKFLLKIDGILKIHVPYDLSLGAWQDPTHVRAFNENSWIYYDQWAWYLNWYDYKLVSSKLEFIPSAYGKDLITRHGHTIEDICRLPRAIDSMYVELIKK